MVVQGQPSPRGPAADAPAAGVDAVAAAAETEKLLRRRAELELDDQPSSSPSESA